MIQELLKDKKKLGIITILIIILITLGTIYLKSGYKELRKNDTESIFIDDIKETDTSNKKYNNDIKNDIATNNKETIIPAKDKSIIVEIKGEVKKPDVYTMDENAIIKDLIEVAGGLTENADLSNINRAEKLQDHKLIYIANKDDITKEPQIVSSSISGQDTSTKKVNINNATIDELKTLNGIGDSKAKSIIEYREQNGGFKSIDQLKDVSGIGDSMFERIKEQIET